MKKLLLNTFLFSALLISCTNSQKPTDEFRVIDLTLAHPEEEFRINDFSEDIRVVRLETTDSSMFNSYSRSYVGDKYIVFFDRDKILQFSSDGKFIKTIAYRGNGPGEFVNVDSWFADKNESNLYYHDATKKSIIKYNLEKGQSESIIPFKDEGYLSKMILINDTLVSVLPSQFTETGNIFFYMTLEGQIVDARKKDPVEHPQGPWAGRSPVFTRLEGNSLIFQPSENDTIFRIEHTDMTPVMTILNEKPQVSGDVTKGKYVGYLFQDDKKIWFHRSTHEIVQNSQMISIRTLESEHLFLDKKSGKITVAKPFIFEYEGADIEIPAMISVEDNHYSITYQAIDFKKQLENALKSNEIPDEKKERLQKMNDEITENDNPILVTGKMK